MNGKKLIPPHTEKNFIINISGQVITLLVILFTIPEIIKQIGVERFGILTIIFVVLEYLGIASIGITRGMIKSISEKLGHKVAEKIGQEIAEITWTSLFIVLCTSVLLGVILASVSSFLTKIFNIPPSIYAESQKAFFISSLVLITNSLIVVLSGVIESHQRFDIVNFLGVPNTVLNFIVIAIVSHFSKNIDHLITFIAIKNFVMLCIYFISAVKFIPKTKIRINTKNAKEILTQSGWITSVFILSVILSRIDRIVLGITMSPEFIGYYTPPSEIILRLQFVPVSIYITLFPVFSYIGLENKEKLKEIFVKYSVYLATLSMLISYILFCAGYEVLYFWLGKDFADEGKNILKILSLFFFLNSQTYIYLTLLQSLGKADNIVKLYIVETPFLTLFVWIMAREFGSEGVAISLVVRGIFENLILFFISSKVTGYKISFKAEKTKMKKLIPFVFALLFCSLAQIVEGKLDYKIKMLEVFAGFITLVIFLFIFVLEDNEKKRIIKEVRKLMGKNKVKQGR